MRDCTADMSKKGDIMKEIRVDMDGNLYNRDDVIQKHRDMWNWLADMSEKEGKVKGKGDYAEDGHEELFSSTDFCYACAYAIHVAHELSKVGVHMHKCEFCPFVWPNSEHTGRCLCCGPVHSDYLLYDIWYLALMCNDVPRAVEVAREIANLPVSDISDEERSIMNGEEG